MDPQRQTRRHLSLETNERNVALIANPDVLREEPKQIFETLEILVLSTEMK